MNKRQTLRDPRAWKCKNQCVTCSAVEYGKRSCPACGGEMEKMIENNYFPMKKEIIDVDSPKGVKVHYCAVAVKDYARSLELFGGVESVDVDTLDPNDYTEDEAWSSEFKV